jgi:hypothetical protein
MKIKKIKLVKIFMDNQYWKRDDKPYLVFICKNCKQYSYVKLGQKTKTCFRCGKRYQVSRISNSGEIVKGITNALNYVKVKQNELMSNAIDKKHDLRTENDFTIAINQKDQYYEKLIEHKKEEKDTINLFDNILKSLSRLYKEFPRFMIEIMAEDFNIPKEDLNILINNFKLNGSLIEVKNQYYKLRDR